MADTYEALFGADYPLNGPITYFEAYMFATTDAHMDEHVLFDDITKAIHGSILLVDKDGATTLLNNPTLDKRRAALTSFNGMLKSKPLDFPNAKKLSCVMIDLEDKSDLYVSKGYRDFLLQLTSIFMNWCQTNQRIGACVHHQEQKDRVPHLHLLYERAPRKHNEFQKHLVSLGF